MSYYRSFKKVFNNPLWNIYLRWAYTRCVEDLKKVGFQPDFRKKDFACLLCGVAMERTAYEFIKFVIARNPEAKIWIIDLGEEQVAAVERLVVEKYRNVDVIVRRINALDLKTLISAGSLDWIETDGFIQYFDSPSLQKLMDVWLYLLKPDGFITFRDFTTGERTVVPADRFRIWLVKVWLKAKIFRHTKEELDSLFAQLNFRKVEGATILPTYKRFSLIKQRF